MRQTEDCETGTTSDIDRHIGRRLRALRISRGHSIYRLAKRMGVPPFDLARIEGGTRRLSMAELWTLTRIYDVETRYFFRVERSRMNKLATYEGKGRW